MSVVLSGVCIQAMPQTQTTTPTPTVHHRKVVLIGPSMGKSRWLSTACPDVGVYESPGPEYATLGVAMHEYTPTRAELARINVWDCGATHVGLGDGYYIQSDGAIIMSRSPAEARMYERAYRRLCDKPVFHVVSGYTPASGHAVGYFDVDRHHASIVLDCVAANIS